MDKKTEYRRWSTGTRIVLEYLYNNLRRLGTATCTVPGLSCCESDTLKEDQDQLLYEAAVIVGIRDAARLPATEADAARLPAKAEGLSVRHPAQQVVKSH